MKCHDISMVNFFLHREPSKKPFACIPMGTLYLTSALEAAGYSVDFHDYQVEFEGNPYHPINILNFLKRTSADILGISCMSNMLPFLLRGLRSFKRHKPGTFIILGGSGPGGTAKEILQSFPEIDAVVRGEGEETIVEILEAHRGQRKLESIAGLTFRSSNGIVVNPPRARKTDIDAIPLPAYHKLPMEKYINSSILTSRGCPYQCLFCDISPNWDRKIAQRSIESVIKEILFLINNYGRNKFSILDDTFILNRGRVLRFCAEIIERKLSIEWSCMCRIDLLDDDLMAFMQKAGCKKIFLGIESGSSRIRNKAGKGFKIDNVEPLIGKAARYFEVAASFILGFPFETIDEFRETIYLIIYCLERGVKPQMSILSPLPQSELNTSGLYKKEFDPDILLVDFDHYKKKSERMNKNILTSDIQEMIKSNPKIFSAFYHYKTGMIREKLELAKKYGLPL
ncbi:MAG: B12-binding domain-containing radical SAM protein [Candidatus Kuenenia sp.]|nr:B12-binding domain-containing radical SAM protein [Candidatus Kuenenia hertensis]